MLNVYNRQKALPVSKSSVRSAANALCRYFSLNITELSVYLIEEKEICRIHKKFFNDPSPTDCITFPMDSSFPSLEEQKNSATVGGDILISPSAALRYDPTQPYREVLLYLVHGFLHILGYDDLTPACQRKMRKMEKQCMGYLDKLRLHITPL